MTRMLSYLKKTFFSRGKVRKRDVPIFLCCHHKVGTVLLAKVFSAICLEFDWEFKGILGKCERVPHDIDVVLFSHALVDLNSVASPYVGAHLIRDPRDVIVSGYLYHRRCSEEWCTNTDFDTSEPILYPKVPYSQQHRPEAWKRQYLASLGNKSYQQNLLERTQSDGLLFEMHNYGAWTIADMLNWRYDNPNIEEVQFEIIMRNFDESFIHLFECFGFTDDQISRALSIAAKEDLKRMPGERLQNDPHISSRKTTKWGHYFTDVHKSEFKQLFGDALLKLGYETSDKW